MVAQNEKMACTLWLNCKKVSECYLYANELFRRRGWGEPGSIMPVEIEAESIQIASNDEEVCLYLNIEPEVGQWA